MVGFNFVCSQRKYFFKTLRKIWIELFGAFEIEVDERFNLGVVVGILFETEVDGGNRHRVIFRFLQLIKLNNNSLELCIRTDRQGFYGIFPH